MKILIVEDNLPAATAIQETLKPWYAVDIAGTADQACSLTYLNSYDLVLLDLGLPDRSGFEVCQELRQRGDTYPILILTGTTSVDSKVTALDAGADDYLDKPFKSAELLARIRALLRRPNLTRSNILRIDSLSLVTSTREVRHFDQPIILGRKEFSLLEYLIIHKGQVITRSQLIEHVWESATSPFSNTIDVHINHLRDLIDRPFGTNLIQTVIGIGYKIEGKTAGE